MALIDKLRVILERVTYKPGHRFVLSREPRGGQIFLTMVIPTVDATKPDAHKPGQPPIEQMMTIALDVDPRDDLEPITFLKRHLIRLTQDFERHEAKEFLKMDGVCIQDPHPGGEIA